MEQTESRFITFPDIEPKQEHIILIVDGTDRELNAVEEFCQTSNDIFDIYLYFAEDDDLQWLSQVAEIADDILVRETSLVTVSETVGAYIFGDDRVIESPLQFIEKCKEF